MPRVLSGLGGALPFFKTGNTVDHCMNGQICAIDTVFPGSKQTIAFECPGRYPDGMSIPLAGTGKLE
jgi:hypothetical protein